MNNATTIRALAAIVVVVLIFTTGSLAAAAATSSSSFTPQPQNLICTHPSNNATCSQEGIISTTQIPLPIPQTQASATLTIIKHLINDIVGTIFAKNSTSSAGSSNVSPQSSFPGAQSPGTTVTLNPGTFPAVLLQRANATTTAVADHNKCSGGDDIITCTHNKEIHHSAKDIATPFVLPIPFP